MLLPKSFENLAKSFEILPGVGEKTAERYVYAIEKEEEENIIKLINAIDNFKKNIKKCSVCNVLSDEEICPICSDKTRNNKTICIVENSKTAFSIDKTNKYKGHYFVLNGLISPIDGVNPEHLYLDKLLNRLNDIEEIIIALNPSIEGEITSLYIQKKLENKKIKVSRLSYGIPAGSEIEYLDPVMISKALEDRKYL